MTGYVSDRLAAAAARDRSEMQGRLDSLRFDNDNNTCLSLRIIAELARQGKVVVERISSMPPADLAFIVRTRR